MSELSAGLTLTALALPVVFAFLGALVVCVLVAGRWLREPTPAEPSWDALESASSTPADPANMDPAIVAAITAAITESRAQRIR